MMIAIAETLMTAKADDGILKNQLAIIEKFYKYFVVPTNNKGENHEKTDKEQAVVLKVF